MKTALMKTLGETRKKVVTGVTGCKAPSSIQEETRNSILLVKSKQQSWDRETHLRLQHQLLLAGGRGQGEEGAGGKNEETKGTRAIGEKDRMCLTPLSLTEPLLS